jgi:CheY-like chemotaxis protein/anti-sigma regulatory factor (Ser/Thr protein kinase)
MTRVLVVDDSPIDRLLAGNLLAQNGGWTVEYASDGQEGLDAIRSQRPDLVVTDMQMPEMNGLELACTVRREFPNVSIILMTARGSEEIALEALQAGATSYVPKRALGQRLVETARRVLSARHEDTVQREVLKRLNVRSESYSMENNLELLLSLSRYLQLTLAHQWGLDLSTRLQIGMALEEAMMNAMHHGNLELDASLKETDEAVYFHMAQQRCHEPRYCDRRIEVEMRLIPQSVTYTIRDQGQGFDLSKLPTEAALEDLVRPCGRGVMLMRAFMDEVTFNEQGNRVTLVKRCPAAD